MIPRRPLVSTPLARGFRQATRRVPGFRPYHDCGAARRRPAGALCQRLSAHRAAAGQGKAGGRGRHPCLGFGVVRRRDGWVGLDPTNKILVGDDHIILAEGRDYADVSPIDGVILELRRPGCGGRRRRHPGQVGKRAADIRVIGGRPLAVNNSSDGARARGGGPRPAPGNVDNIRVRVIRKTLKGGGEAGTVSSVAPGPFRKLNGAAYAAPVATSATASALVRIVSFMFRPPSVRSHAQRETTDRPTAASRTFTAERPSRVIVPAGSAAFWTRVTGRRFLRRGRAVAGTPVARTGPSMPR